MGLLHKIKGRRRMFLKKSHCIFHISLLIILYTDYLLASRNVTSRSSSRSFLLPTKSMTIAGLAKVLASVNQLDKALNDSLDVISYTKSAPAAPR